MSCGMDLTDGALKSAQTYSLNQRDVKVGGSNIIGLQKWVGPVPPTYNGSDAHKHIINKIKLCTV